MTSIEAVILEVPDPAAANAFYSASFALGPRLKLRAGDAPTSGFRGFTLSLGVSQPATVDALLESAIEAGATSLKPAKKSLWGYGGAVQAPDGAIWTVASSAKKGTGPPTRQVDAIVLQLGVADVAATKRFYIDHGLEVARSMGRRYVEFTTTGIQLSALPRRGLAKNAGVSADGSGSPRMSIVSDAGRFTDLDGFAWEPLGAGGQPAEDATSAAAIGEEL